MAVERLVALVFYHCVGGIATELAVERVLEEGRVLARRLDRDVPPRECLGYPHLPIFLLYNYPQLEVKERTTARRRAALGLFC